MLGVVIFFIIMNIITGIVNIQSVVMLSFSTWGVVMLIVFKLNFVSIVSLN
jgi:hypothetical protein